jgi:hypothetical protein
MHVHTHQYTKHTHTHTPGAGAVRRNMVRLSDSALRADPSGVNGSISAWTALPQGLYLTRLVLEFRVGGCAYRCSQ